MQSLAKIIKSKRTANKSILVYIAMVCCGTIFACTVTLSCPGETPFLVKYSAWFMIILSSIFYLWTFGYSFHKQSLSLKLIRQQIHNFEHNDNIGMIMIDSEDELSELVKVINHYLTNIKFSFEKYQLTHRELELQSRVSETERLQAEAVLTSISEAVIVTDESDELIMGNQKAQDIFEFSTDLNYRMNIKNVLDDTELVYMITEVRTKHLNQITRIIERPCPVSDRMLTFKIIASCVLDSKHNATGVVIVVHDITAEKELAQMKDDIVSCVSHELKTPLSSIKAYAEMLADNEIDNDVTRVEFCDVILDQTDRLNRMISDILNISKIESDSNPIEKQTLILNTFIDHIIDTLKPQALDKNITINVDIENDKLAISADRDMMFQSILNLLSNAIKYSNKDTTVIIRAWRYSDSEVAIEVKDHGIGIPENSLDQIFDKFYRVPEHRSFAGGTGLGLNLVRQVVHDIHNGRITVQSKAGQGSSFVLYLPFTPVHEFVLS